MEDACREESKGEENPPLPPPSISSFHPTTPGFLPGSNARHLGACMENGFLKEGLMDLKSSCFKFLLFTLMGVLYNMLDFLNQSISVPKCGGARKKIIEIPLM